MSLVDYSLFKTILDTFFEFINQKETLHQFNFNQRENVESYVSNTSYITESKSNFNKCADIVYHIIERAIDDGSITNVEEIASRYYSGNFDENEIIVNKIFDNIVEICKRLDIYEFLNLNENNNLIKKMIEIFTESIFDNIIRHNITDNDVFKFFSKFSNQTAVNQTAN
ncbi:hypothetical protein GVAV_001501 [Gurleya vavrai]